MSNEFILLGVGTALLGAVALVLLILFSNVQPPVQAKSTSGRTVRWRYRHY